MPEIKLPPQAQQLLVQLQTFQQHLQAVLLQKESLTIQKVEIEKALEELDKAKEGEDVYKAVGPILIKSTKKTMQKELKEKNETNELRLKSLGRQENKIKEKAKETQDKLQTFFKPSAAD